jgi:hypothetical protein
MGVKVLQMQIEGQPRKDVMSDDFMLLQAQKGRKLSLQVQKKCMLKGKVERIEFSSDLPIIIDTRLDVQLHNPRVENALSLYTHQPANAVFKNTNAHIRKVYSRLIDLPYRGTISAVEGAIVQPDDVIGINQYDPARLFVINAIPTSGKISEELIRGSIQVNVGDHITYNQVLALAIPSVSLHRPFLSPVRAKVEYIEYAVGLIIASEIQDYDMKPHKINVAEKLNVKPKLAQRYIVHNVGDFVYEEENIARKADRRSGMLFAKAPSTGQVIDFDMKRGIMTIQYPDKAFEYKALVQGKVLSVEEGKSAEIEFEAERLEATIGWGPKVYGTLRWIDDITRLGLQEGDFAVLGFSPNADELQKLLKAKIRAIICPSVDELLIPKYLGMEQGVINTGFENPGSSLILMQGFGALPYSAEQQSFFRATDGKACFIDPHTRIRAGVVRAGIYVQK